MAMALTAEMPSAQGGIVGFLICPFSVYRQLLLSTQNSSGTACSIALEYCPRILLYTIQRFCAADLPLAVSSGLLLIGEAGLSSLTQRMCLKCPTSMFRPWNVTPVVTMPYSLLGLTCAWNRP